MKRYGEWAFIAGGSEGTGAEFARRFAEDGVSLVLTARRTGPLDALAASIRAAHPMVEVRTIAVDLTGPTAMAEIRKSTAGLEIGILVCNAGSTDSRGEFVDQELDIHHRLITLNVIGRSTCAICSGKA